MIESLPSIVPLHPSDTLEVSEHAGYHSRYAGDAFEEDESCDPLFLCHWIDIR